MDYTQVKKNANEILKNRIAECSYIEYKSSEKQLDEILKTVCAYGNNYCGNDMHYLFIGIEKEKTAENKAIPVLPIKGIAEGQLEKRKSAINSLRSFLYPEVSFEVIANQFAGKNYLLLIVRSHTGGPFMVALTEENSKKINLKPGRYVRIGADTRLARVDEEYDLFRKFVNFHYSSAASADAVLDDLDLDILAEYAHRTATRPIYEGLSKRELARMLNLLDKNDPDGMRVKNYAVLMFAEHPETIIPYAYAELIIDVLGTRRKMMSKVFKGAAWKQYYAALNYIDRHILNELVIRGAGDAVDRKIRNFPYIAVEELLANAFVHNNYENGKPIQVYVSEKQINIVNYNKPLPPLRISDLNERSSFNERDTENPELRDMFKALGIIESFGTGIGEAKRAMRENGSPNVYYKTFENNGNVTSVVIPINEEYFEIKSNDAAKETAQKTGSIDPVAIETETQSFKQKVLKADFSDAIKINVIRLREVIGTEVFGNSRIVAVLGCSEVTATSYIKRMHKDLQIAAPVNGMGKGKYRFIV